MDIGRRIRRLRTAKHLTLSELAKKVGMSSSYLSQIENGKVNLTISSLQSIATGLEIAVADFFTQPQEAEYVVIRKQDQRAYRDDNGIEETILFAHNESQLETTLIKLPPDAAITGGSSHQGEEFTFVMSGAARVLLNGLSFDLYQGDIIYYDSSLSHTWENVSKEESTILVCNTPKTF